MEQLTIEEALLKVSEAVEAEWTDADHVHVKIGPDHLQSAADVLQTLGWEPRPKHLERAIRARRGEFHAHRIDRVDPVTASDVAKTTVTAQTTVKAMSSDEA